MSQDKPVLPCPFCGGTKCAITPTEYSDKWVICGDCGAEGPPIDKEQGDAVEAWNRRALDRQGSGWISVEERLPEEGMGVLVTDGQDVLTGGWGDYTDFDHRHSGGFATVKGWYGHNLGYDGDSGPLGVTHWMPLPPPPQAQDAQTGEGK